MRTDVDVEEKIQTAIGLHNDGKLPEARKIYEDIIATIPNHFNALQLLGLASLQAGETERAVELLSKAIAVDGNYSFTHRNLGNALARLGRLDAAVASYDRAIALQRDFAEAYRDRGDARKMLNRIDEAIADYGKAIALKPDFADAYNKLGVALNDIKRHVEALAQFEKAIRLRPDFPQAKRNQQTAVEDMAQWDLVLLYKSIFGVLPRLHPPISFNEHILHRIIYDRDPKLRITCDKLAVRKIIEERVGAEYVVPLLGVWERAGDITWDTLPEKFVLKPSHASGPFAIVDPAVGTTREKFTEAAEEWLSYDYFDRSLEWGYLGLPRRLLAEPFLRGPDGGRVPEAQVHTFAGKAALIRVLVGIKFSENRIGYWFDATGRRVLVRRSKPRTEFDLSDKDRKKLVEVAEAIAHDFSSLRTDFFLTDNGLKINELTPYTNQGMTKWGSLEVDEKLGQLWNPNCDLSVIPDYLD